MRRACRSLCADARRLTSARSAFAQAARSQLRRSPRSSDGGVRGAANEEDFESVALPAAAAAAAPAAAAPAAAPAGAATGPAAGLRRPRSSLRSTAAAARAPAAAADSAGAALAPAAGPRAGVAPPSSDAAAPRAAPSARAQQPWWPLGGGAAAGEASAAAAAARADAAAASDSLVGAIVEDGGGGAEEEEVQESAMYQRRFTGHRNLSSRMQARPGRARTAAPARRHRHPGRAACCLARCASCGLAPKRTGGAAGPAQQGACGIQLCGRAARPTAGARAHLRLLAAIDAPRRLN